MPRAADPRARARSVLRWAAAAGALLLAAAPVVSALDRGQYGPQYVQRLDLIRRLPAGHTPLAFVGSSRVVIGFLPERLPPLRDASGRTVVPFNFGHTSAGPSMNAVELRRLLADGVRPGYLLVELAPLFMGRDRPRQTARETGLADVPAVLGHTSKPAEYLAELAQQHAARGPRALAAGLRGWLPGFAAEEFVPPPFPLRPLGGLDKAEDTPAERALAAATPFPSPLARWPCFRVTAEADRAVADIARLCREHGIALRFVISPERSSLRAWYPPGTGEELARYAASLRERYGAETADARAWLDDTDFPDDHHATRGGAAKFTDRLHREVIAPWLASGE